jgi:peroxiredoxin
MRIRKSWLMITLATAAVAAAGLVAGSFVSRAIDRSPPPAKPALGASLATGRSLPEGTLYDARGYEVGLHDWVDGHPTVIVVLSTDCEPCHDLASEWHTVFSNVPALNIVAISVESPDRVLEFLDRYGIDVTVLIDPDRAWTHARGIPAFPTFIGVDAAGAIVWTEVGYEKGEHKNIEPLLAGL